jgi:hypothetical protein
MRVPEHETPRVSCRILTIDEPDHAFRDVSAIQLAVGAPGPDALTLDGDVVVFVAELPQELQGDVNPAKQRCVGRSHVVDLMLSAHFEVG